jgi:bifunctional NMN adenylyltransferase/nudix hydrolase
MTSQSVFVGSFQPPTKLDVSIAEKLASQSHQVFVVIAVHAGHRDIKNTFSPDQRVEMWHRALASSPLSSRIEVVTASYNPYGEDEWRQNLRAAVRNKIPFNRPLWFSGEAWYLQPLKKFWDNKAALKHEAKSKSLLSLESADLTTSAYANPVSHHWSARRAVIKKEKTLFPEPVNQWLAENYRGSPQHREHLRELESVLKYRKSWAKAPFAPIFSTVDAVVICQKHILLIERDHDPGKGTFALPGGFLDQHEFTVQGSIRELLEETRIAIDPSTLFKTLKCNYVFDFSERSALGRVISHGYLFKVKSSRLPRVQASDDAAKAFWFPVRDLEKLIPKFFEDHYLIIKKLMKLEKEKRN